MKKRIFGSIGALVVIASIIAWPPMVLVYLGVGLFIIALCGLAVGMMIYKQT